MNSSSLGNRSVRCSTASIHARVGRGTHWAAGVAALAASIACCSASAQVAGKPAEGFIGGVVTGARGPEAGVWVIAETSELKTPFIKIVVTDDAGRYVLPQLPEATYNVWVRGYGLADSDKVEGRPGDAALNLTAKAASSPAEAAKVYPGNYWLSLLQPPAKSEFPGTGESGNGIPPAMASQAHWMFNLKSGCNFCHQLGNEITRSLGHMDHLGFKTPEEAWIYRTQLGVRGSSMAGTMARACSPIGPRESQMASCRRHRRGRGRVPSATSS
jgi:hypothetical protein